MPIKVIDEQSTMSIEVEGTVFYVRPMNVTEQMRLQETTEGIDPKDPKVDPERWDRTLDIIALTIQEIEGFEGKDPRAVLGDMTDSSEQSTVVRKILELKSLDATEVKNSESSSGTHKANLAGAGSTVGTDAGPADASTGKRRLKRKG